jgi:2-methylaconitate cis-trans-isomerase PrpF
MRGGTSRAIFFREEALAKYDAAARDRIILAAMGSPDPHGRQVDGLGGGISSLSKVAVIGRQGSVNFNFGQVEVERASIDWSGTCGNISAAVGPYAIDEGLWPVTEPVTHVPVRSVNTGKHFIAHVPVRGGMAETEGDYVIDGVPGSGAKITLEFLEPGASLGRGVLPTGMPVQEVQMPGHKAVKASIVDAVIPMVFVRAADMKADATKPAAELDKDTRLQNLLEAVRCQAAVLLGLAKTASEAHERSKAVPKVAMVAQAASYAASGTRFVQAREVDIVARAVSMGNTHRTFPASATMCAAVAASIEGTLVQEATGRPAEGRLRIGHPAGAIEVAAKVERKGGDWLVPSITTYRTARRIMEGYVVVPERRLT